MGWGNCGLDNLGRPIGYNFEGTCDYPECEEKIYRGLDAVCGSMHYGGEFGCGRYFCSKHLIIGKENLCPNCYEEYIKKIMEKKMNNNETIEEAYKTNRALLELKIERLTEENKTLRERAETNRTVIMNLDRYNEKLETKIGELTDKRDILQTQIIEDKELKNRWAAQIAKQKQNLETIVAERGAVVRERDAAVEAAYIEGFCAGNANAFTIVGHQNSTTAWEKSEARATLAKMEGEQMKPIAPYIPEPYGGPEGEDE